MQIDNVITLNQNYAYKMLYRAGHKGNNLILYS